mgnify:CR=1 FL=1
MGKLASKLQAVYLGPTEEWHREQKWKLLEGGVYELMTRTPRRPKT